MKEQNSALLQELASWGYIVLSVDHPHDAALVLYPDGSTADFRGYDMLPTTPRHDWWKFRNQHLRWRVLDCKYALDRMTEMNENPNSDFFGRLDFGRVAAMGHSFGGRRWACWRRRRAHSVLRHARSVDVAVRVRSNETRDSVSAARVRSAEVFGESRHFLHFEFGDDVDAVRADGGERGDGDEREPHRLSDVFEAVAEDERSESEDEKSSSSVDSLDAFQRRDIPTSPERPASRKSSAGRRRVGRRALIHPTDTRCADPTRTRGR